ncbi:MAG: PAS domain S-box protein [Dehalococcoidales bacterium]|jgi:PAS domain S-box-containing protein
MATGSSRILPRKDNIIRAVVAASRWLTEPSVVIDAKQQRRVRLLAAFLLLMTLATLAGAISLKKMGSNAWLITAASSVLFLLTYIISRTRYHRAALMLTLVVPAIPSVSVAIIKPPEINVTAELMWLSLPLLIASLMLTVRQTITLASIYIITIVILASSGLLGFEIIAPLMAYILIITFIVTTIAAVGRKDRAEIELNLAERLNIEQTLRESEEKFSKAFHASPNAMSLSTIDDGVFLEINQGYTDITGYTRADMISQNADKLDLWADAENRGKMLSKILGQVKIRNEECDIRIKSGEIRTMLLSTEYLQLNGHPCALVVGSDITQRKRMEQALRDSEEKFSKAFNSSPSAICIVSLEEDKFVEVNDSFSRFTGYPRQEIIGRGIQDLGLLVNKEELEQVIGVLQEKGSVYNVEFPSRSKSGEIRMGLFSATIINIGGKPYVMLVITDITEQKQAQEKLKQAMTSLEHYSAQLKATNKELESFSYSVSHDLRSPLRSIDGFSQALLEDYKSKLDKTGRDYLQRLRSASQKMGELIDGLLKLSRLTRSEMHLEDIDLSALAGEISDRLQETQPDNRAKFVIDRGLSAVADPEMVRVLMENLLGNAWKFSGKTSNPRIEFGSTVKDHVTTFFVKDNGAGFDMAYNDKLFGAFQRLHDSTDFPGTGIGLATVQRIINRHGGTIRAEGAVGKGATFYFTLTQGAQA